MNKVLQKAQLYLVVSFFLPPEATTKIKRLVAAALEDASVSFRGLLVHMTLFLTFNILFYDFILFVSYVLNKIMSMSKHS